jgi:hypothetical protein
VQEFNNMTLPQYHRSDIFQIFALHITALLEIFSRDNPKLSQHPLILRDY